MKINLIYIKLTVFIECILTLLKERRPYILGDVGEKRKIYYLLVFSVKKKHSKIFRFGSLEQLYEV